MLTPQQEQEMLQEFREIQSELNTLLETDFKRFLQRYESLCNRFRYMKANWKIKAGLLPEGELAVDSDGTTVYTNGIRVAYDGRNRLDRELFRRISPDTASRVKISDWEIEGGLETFRICMASSRNNLNSAGFVVRNVYKTLEPLLLYTRLRAQRQPRDPSLERAIHQGCDEAFDEQGRLEIDLTRAYFGRIEPIRERFDLQMARWKMAVGLLPQGIAKVNRAGTGIFVGDELVGYDRRGRLDRRLYRMLSDGVRQEMWSIRRSVYSTSIKFGYLVDLPKYGYKFGHAPTVSSMQGREPDRAGRIWRKQQFQQTLTRLKRLNEQSVNKLKTRRKR